MDERRTNGHTGNLVSLAAAPGLLLLVTRIALAGNTLPVTTCLDDGSAGSLRSVIAIAANGDSVDLGGLDCPLIQLIAGELVVAQDNLALTGPGAAMLTIEPQSNSRVIDHSGTGILAITALTIRHGTMLSSSIAEGGCIRSAGSLTLDHAVVSSCTASGVPGAAGGGVFAAGTLDMKSSQLTNNRAIKSGSAPTPLPSASGGGASTHDFSSLDSTVSGNSAEDDSTALSRGGGIDYQGGAFIRRSTIDHNTANYGGGLAGNGGGTDLVFRSTISNNTATVAGGGLYGNAFFNVHQSTVAFNTGSATGAGGIQNNSTSSGLVDLWSSIVADNEPSTSAGADVAADDMKTFALSSDQSLVMRTEANILGSIISADPLLGPLADNGGPTRTHALLPGSPALQAGWNTATPCDQRQAFRGYYVDSDMGAYEDPGEHIFWGDFDVCL
ncbi:choice-of-anchor Q domain-containing protein [Dokdonella immobilis]|uniref:Polymorphic outer membrane protein repeat-containing protein n=1 Tax=Dokdonella immobilis TaxID=578942 RepID=A0A1I4YFF4_9GAMM|nr:choice-of-anchor Q domain-containing protein [Dokdonella immobilis]SFN36754.1 hypothetical protein SAMN05216289_11728 [Dokdonella immobilis]